MNVVESFDHEAQDDTLTESSEGDSNLQLSKIYQSEERGPVNHQLRKSPR